ncbi:helix-turn-helix domain-containing protein [Flectobacillus sp. DC10W]|uniref:Helix-turn-helix domain-containing protein n=1 Tax=Flectobacillus longus TaxID=2984207 RepID=A0ABT6YH94_9BACT|nr:helix-turn-helix domain-containing protein [Flectobacillus longus]MDI9862973.1 helix-turn-helix domain-containing protein [Flectobacillus longus]
MINGIDCPKNIRSIKDTLETLQGKWKLLILFTLSSKPKRFKQISKDVKGISDKVLANELKSLETNTLITRTPIDTYPPTVEYSITPHGQSLQKVVEELHLWGIEHRKVIMEE